MSRQNPYKIDSQEWYHWECRAMMRRVEQHSAASINGLYREAAIRKRLVVQSIPVSERFRLASLRAYNEGRVKDHVSYARAAESTVWRNRHVPLIRRAS